jgi:hypothetical protein
MMVNNIPSAFAYGALNSAVETSERSLLELLGQVPGGTAGLQTGLSVQDSVEISQGALYAGPEAAGQAEGERGAGLQGGSFVGGVEEAAFGQKDEGDGSVNRLPGRVVDTLA